MKRWFVASGIFVLGAILLFLPILYKSARNAAALRASGVETGLVVTRVSPYLTIMAGMLLAGFAVWLSARLVK